MMTMLMCFFVLLLSFAEMDVLKYKQVAGALKLAFGVQRIVKAPERTEGTSVIAKQYSPGKPTEVTPLEIMRKQATDDTKTSLDYSDSRSKNDGGIGEAEAEAIAQQKSQREAQAEAEELQDELSEAIGDHIDDEVMLALTPVEDNEIDGRLEDFWSNQHEFSIRNDYYYQIMQHIADRHKIETRMPELARCLSVLE